MKPQESEFRFKDHLPTRGTAHELVGRGWWHLVDEAFDASEREGVRITRIREKFGLLRVE